MSLLSSKLFSLAKKKRLAPMRTVAFDLDGTSVGILLTDHMPGAAPTILLSKRVDLPVRESFDPARNLAEVMTLVEQLGREVLKDFPGTYGKIYFFLTSPYVASQTRTVTTRYEKQTLITDQALSALVEGEIASFRKTELEHFKDTEGADNHVMLESKVMATRLNGYETAVPAGKMARDIELALYLSIVSEGISRKLTSITKALFPDVPSELHSRAFALFHTIRHISPEHSYMIVDIRGEVTELGVVKNGVLIDTISHPTGEYAVLRNLAQTLGSPVETVHSSLSLLVTEAGHEEEHARITQALGHAKIEWLGGFGLILKQTLEDYLLPARMYVYANPLTAPFFKDFLSDSNLYQYSAASVAFQVTLVDHSFFNTEGSALKESDTILLSLARCIDSLYAHKGV